MHLCPPHITNTVYNRKKKKPSAKQLKAEAEHEAWLKKLAKKHHINLDAKKKPTVDSDQSLYRRTAPNYPSQDSKTWTAAKKEPMMYTGDRLLGIATMHKSNMVPVFSKQEAEDISKMRRG
jgi:hypothetical protein